MKLFKTSPLLLTFIALIAGCTAVPVAQKPKIIETYQDMNSFFQGKWVLLAQSSTRDWFYDPRTLSENEEGVVQFTSYWNYRDNAKSAQRAAENSLQVTSNQEVDRPIEKSIYGPYLQKIDCSTHAHMTESLIDGRCDLSDDPQNSQNSLIRPGAIECWRNTKRKVAITFIENRVCGRKFPMERTKNYFLFQQDDLQSTINASNDSAESAGENHKTNFYEVINNEYVLVDAKKNIRQMRVSKYRLDKNLSLSKEYLYQANCTEKTDNLALPENGFSNMRPVGIATSFSGVAFNRLCADHGRYMRQVARYTK